MNSLEQLEALINLEAIQMEGNPVWSNPNYSCVLVAVLPALVKLDQQDITQVQLILYACSSTTSVSLKYI